MDVRFATCDVRLHLIKQLLLQSCIFHIHIRIINYIRVDNYAK